MPIDKKTTIPHLSIIQRRTLSFAVDAACGGSGVVVRRVTGVEIDRGLTTVVRTASGTIATPIARIHCVI